MVYDSLTYNLHIDPVGRLLGFVTPDSVIADCSVDVIFSTSSNSFFCYSLAILRLQYENMKSTRQDVATLPTRMIIRCEVRGKEVHNMETISFDDVFLRRE